MKSILKVLLPIVFVLSSWSVQAQSNSQRIFGKIIDAKSNKEIAFATVLMKDSKRGVIADENGVFNIPTTAIRDYKSIIISCIGYQTKEVDLQKLKTNGVNIILLDVAVSALDEVLVKAKKKRLTAKQIVKKAIHKIPDNYPLTPFAYAGYYRDYQKDSTNYINLNEAIVKIYDGGFQTYDREHSKISLLEYKENQQFVRESDLLTSYDNAYRKFIPKARIHPSGGNELTILMAHDAIRNYEYQSYSFMYIMKKHFVKHHSFKLVEITQIDNENLYVINFELRPAVSYEHTVRGQLFINRNSFAIHKLDYSLYRKKEQQNIFNLQVAYKEYKEKLYLNYISFSNTFSAPNPKDFFVANATYNPYREYIRVAFSNSFALKNIYKLSNYKITIDNERVPVKKVVLDPSDPKKLRLLLDFKTDEPPIITDETLNRLQVDISNVKDKEGRKLGEITYLTYKQYRELFVQEVFTNNVKRDVFIDKFKPLPEGEKSQFLEKERYWMNTPLESSK